MNVTLATTELQAALGDSAGAIYVPKDISSALTRSVRAFSQYFPCLRRVGSAQLNAQVSKEALQISVVGGILSAGAQLVLDVGSAAQETVTVAEIVAKDDASEPTGYTTVNLVAPMVNTHTAGALILPVGGPGLIFQANQDSALLPVDFVKPEQESFDMAVGAKMYYRAGDSYYDATATISNQLSGTGFGRAATFGPQQAFGYPIVGNPYNNPNSGMPTTGQMAWRFYLSDTPYLRAMPAPGGTTRLDFDYYGCHTLQSVPSADQEVITLYGRYAALSARANAFQEQANMGAPGDVRIEDYEQSGSKNVMALLRLAQDALKLWEDKVRFIPIGTGG